MTKLKHLFPFPHTFQSFSFLIMTFLVLGLSQPSHAITFEFTGCLSGFSIIGSVCTDTSSGGTHFSGYFSLDMESAKIIETDTHAYFIALTQFSITVDGMQDPSINQTSTGRIDVWNDHPSLGDRVEFTSSIGGEQIFLDGEYWEPYNVNLLFRYASTDTLGSTDLPQTFDLLNYPLIDSISHGSWAYRSLDDQSSVKVQFFKLDSITPVSVPEPGTLLLLGSGLAGILLLRKKRE